MTIIYFILPLSLLLTLGFVLAYIWAVRSGQFKDIKTPAIRILFDDDDATHTGPQKK